MAATRWWLCLQVVSAEHALSLVALGEAQRKVSQTQYNDASSRSHTLCRVTIESCNEGRRDRMISVLNLIDLAGSESGRAATTTNHRMEGSYINKVCHGFMSLYVTAFGE